ncbi:MAG: ABC transporter ATP-binding protein [Proteobacteria bacterium]|nr:ABC transporter ATP-binding protein [Pseudomonadota bacterium]
MATITFQEIAHRYHQSKHKDAGFVVNNLSQCWQDGGAYALLGPSGCGKTTLLNIISGLVKPTAGKVLFDEIDVTDLSPQQRNIAQVFQFPVVYDTLTVAANLAFPLRNRGLVKTEIDSRVQSVLAILGLEEIANLKARSLNADDKQKISLGRGLVRTDVKAILFDEPLTVIDPHLKWELRTELKRIHQQFQHTMIYVTHDQTEALTFADQVMVMYEGAIVQVGTPQELFEKPQHTFVGKFIGSPGMNILPCAVDGSVAVVDGNRIDLQQDYELNRTGLEIGIRPEHITLSNDRGIAVQVTAVEDVGKHIVVRTKLGDHNVNIIVREGVAIPENPRIWFDPSKLNLFQNSYLLGVT